MVIRVKRSLKPDPRGATSQKTDVLHRHNPFVSNFDVGLLKFANARVFVRSLPAPFHNQPFFSANMAIKLCFKISLFQ
jgi:hypothetical protein